MLPTRIRKYASLALSVILLISCDEKSKDRSASMPSTPIAPPRLQADTRSASPLPMNRQDPPASAWAYSGQEDFAGLKLHILGAPLADASTALVLFHGYGAEGDDLLPLGRILEAGNDLAILLPEAPVSLPSGGRAWFRRDRSNLSMGVERARALLVSLIEKYAELSLIVAGFSQGGILAANLIETSGFPLKAAIMLSPADVLLTPLKGSYTTTPLFISHGKMDPVLPFSGSEHLRDRLTNIGYSVRWAPFGGRHTISRSVVTELNQFLQTLIAKQ